MSTFHRTLAEEPQFIKGEARLLIGGVHVEPLKLSDHVGVHVAYNTDKSDFDIEAINRLVRPGPSLWNLSVSMPIVDDDQAARIWDWILGDVEQTRRARSSNLTIGWGGGEQDPGAQVIPLVSWESFRALLRQMRDTISYEFRKSADLNFDWPWSRSFEIFDMQLEDPIMVPLPNHGLDWDLPRRHWPDRFRFSAAKAIYTIRGRR